MGCRRGARSRFLRPATVEDDDDEGERAIRALKPGPKDVVVGISASGITPFVRGAVTRARMANSRVIGITCDPKSELKKLADVAIVLVVGPEVIAGSTRLKAGTATKVVLNMLTTAAMVRAGKTYGNLMVDVRSNSEKLRDRARRIVGNVTGLDEGAAGVRAAYGDRLPRLMALKDRYDPTNVFRLNANIPSTTGGNR